MFLCPQRCCTPGCTLSGCPDPLPILLHGTDHYGGFTLGCINGGSVWTGVHVVNYVACGGCSFNVPNLTISYTLVSKTGLQYFYRVGVGTCPGNAGNSGTITFPTPSGTCSPLSLTFAGGSTALFCPGSTSVTITL